MNIHLKFLLALLVSLLLSIASILLIWTVPFHGYALLPFAIPIVLFGFCTFGLFLSQFQSADAKRRNLKDFGHNWLYIIFRAIMLDL